MIAARTTRLLSDWRWFPIGMLATLAIVFAVNGTMIYFALSTFPGQAGEDGFDLSNAYDRVLALSAQQSVLGWQLTLEAGPDRHTVMRVMDQTGAPLSGPVIEARAERPIGPKNETALILRPAGPGRLQSEQALMPGRWTVFLTVKQGGNTLTATHQLTVR